MLELGDSKELTTEFWNSLPIRADLPCSPDKYLDKSGPLGVLRESRRGYHRFYLRTIALLRCDGNEYAAYCKDLSRMGIGFFSPVQLFPGDVISLEIPGNKPLRLEVARCIRIRERCYECGSQFATYS